MDNEKNDSITEMEKDGKWLQGHYAQMKQKFPNKFVAVKNQKIIATGKDIKQVIKGIEKKGRNPALILVEFIYEEKLNLIL